MEYREVEPVYHITLGKLADAIRGFRESRRDLLLPDLNDRFIRRLQATYLSYLPPESFAYDLRQRRDERGELAELLKSRSLGQFFVSRTRPGLTRGNHYHDTKVEKFAVLEGEALVRFRSVLPETGGGKPREPLTYRVSGKDFRVVDIPPGYTHAITNVGTGDMVVLFWASEIFDPARPDTFYEEVNG